MNGSNGRAAPQCVEHPGATGRYFVVADLHLDGSDRAVRQLETLLASARESDSELFILGDLFSYWFGRGNLHCKLYQREIEMLRRATGSGLKVWILHGNRDFLLDGAFSHATGVSVLGEDHEIYLPDGARVHLSHGDRFSSADLGYQRLRRVLRTTTVRFLAHRLPAFFVHRLARRLRLHSQRASLKKPAAIFEPDRELVAMLFRRGCSTVICGHFHHGRDEVFPREEGGGRFIILEPFEERGYVLVHDGQRWRSRWLAVNEKPQ